MNRWEDFRVWSSTSPFREDILDDRVALVTGGGSGIGFEMARQLGLHGSKLVLFGRRANFLDEACARLRDEGIECCYSAGDVRKPDDCAAAVAVAEETYGHLNVLINGAAGMFPASMGESLSPNGFKTVVEIDVLGTYNMSAAALPALKKTGQAVVINTTVPPHFLRGQMWWVSHMQAAKAAVTTMSQSMAKEWAEYGIRCCNVAPGAIADTPAALKQGNRAALTSEAELSPDGIPVARHVPLGRMGTSFECAMAVVFICVSEYITAETITVDGG